MNIKNMMLAALLAVAAGVAVNTANAEIKLEDYSSYEAYLNAVTAYNASYSGQRYDNPAPKQAAVDDSQSEVERFKKGAEIKYDRNEIWVSHEFESRALCEVYIDGEPVGRQLRVPNWVPFVYQHDSSLRDISSWEGSCEVVPYVNGSGKAVDYSREATNANFDREREEWLVRQGSTLSNKFQVREREMTPEEKAEAIRAAEKRYQESVKSTDAPPSEAKAGIDYQSEIDALLKSMK